MSETHTQFVNVHEALNIASFESKKKVSLVPCSVKIHPEVRDRAHIICARHGTDLSAFLRTCVEALVNDYSKEPVNQEG